ncbi:MAG: dTDP-4-dehydrorhamnose reductase [Micropepsaceae bacterium]
MKPTPTLALFGANGQLGHAIERVAEQRGVTVVSFDRLTADVTDITAVAEALDRAPGSLIVNAAAYTAVDRAESEENRAFAINRDGAGNVARVADRLGLPLIHISTDYVFDGTKKGAWIETDPVAPINAYGRSKEAGERVVHEHCPYAIVLRTSWVYGLEGANFVKTMLRLGAERDELRIVDDQHGCPTFADDLAAAILTIAGKYEPGLFHLAGSGETSWFEFAQGIFAGRDHPRLHAITTDEYLTPARRPANSVLDCTRARDVFGVKLPHWKDGLKRMLKGLQT